MHAQTDVWMCWVALTAIHSQQSQSRSHGHGFLQSWSHTVFVVTVTRTVTAVRGHGHTVAVVHTLMRTAMRRECVSPFGNIMQLLGAFHLAVSVCCIDQRQPARLEISAPKNDACSKLFHFKISLNVTRDSKHYRSRTICVS